MKWPARRGNDYTDRVPAIAEALAKLRVKSVSTADVAHVRIGT
jgi:hypothetical protein